MKTKLLSIMLALTLLLALSACGKTAVATIGEGAAQSTASSEATANSENAASSETSGEKSRWFDEEANNERLASIGIPYKLNDDGTKPAEWTMEYYMTDEYADCIPEVNDVDGEYIISNTALEHYWSTIKDKIGSENVYSYNIPSQQVLAMLAADMTRALPDGPIMDEAQQEKILEDVTKYVESRGAAEYPFVVYNYYVSKDSEDIEVDIGFINDNLTEAETAGTFLFTAYYSPEDFSNQGYQWFEEAIDSTYGDGTYASLDDTLASDATSDASSVTYTAA